MADEGKDVDVEAGEGEGVPPPQGTKEPAPMAPKRAPFGAPPNLMMVTVIAARHVPDEVAGKDVRISMVYGTDESRNAATSSATGVGAMLSEGLGVGAGADKQARAVRPWQQTKKAHAPETFPEGGQLEWKQRFYFEMSTSKQEVIKESLEV